jgi:predicted nucleic acid-binding protein
VNFLLDTDICSAHMRRPTKLARRFIQYTGQVAISTVTLAELYAGAYKHSHPIGWWRSLPTCCRRSKSFRKNRP